jgi:outer membrane lipoprotein-sorting protein
MRRLMVTFAALGVLLAVVLQSGAGEEAGDIIAKAIKAHHPKGVNEKHQAYHGKNKGTLHVAGLELEFSQEVWVQTPGKFKEVMEMTVMNNAVKATTVFNGKEGWIKVNNMDIPVKEELLDEFKDMAYMMGLAQLTGLKDPGLKLSLLGEVQVNGKPALGVKVSKEGKKDINFYFDKASSLLVKTERRARDFMTGQELTEERIVTEYQDLSGRKMAKKVQVNRDGKKLLDAEVLEARVLEKLDDDEFAKP